MAVVVGEGEAVDLQNLRIDLVWMEGERKKD